MLDHGIAIISPVPLWMNKTLYHFVLCYGVAGESCTGIRRGAFHPRLLYAPRKNMG